MKGGNFSNSRPSCLYHTTNPTKIQVLSQVRHRCISIFTFQRWFYGADVVRKCHPSPFRNRLRKKSCTQTGILFRLACNSPNSRLWNWRRPAPALHACGSGVRCGHDRVTAEAFCSSPYLSRETYAETLNELVELFFYLYKSETGERVTDDGLIRYMRAAFDGPCGGSLELHGRAFSLLGPQAAFRAHARRTRCSICCIVSAVEWLDERAIF
ncbi:MAG: DUF6323 family protein [Intestinimonas sp.]